MIIYYLSQRIDVGKQFLFCESVNLFRKIFINNINYKYMHFQKVVSYLQMESSDTDISYDF